MIHLQKQALPYREPQSVFGALFGQDPHAIWLDSASLTNKAPYSYMARPTVLLKANQSPYLQVTELQTPLLEIQWPSRLTMSDLIPLMNTHRHSESKGPPFQGGLMGFMAYEYAHFLDTPIPYQTHTCDDLYWLWIEDFYYWDHEQQHCYAMAIGHDPTQVQKRVTSLTQNYHNACKNPFKVPQKAKRGPIRTHTPKSVYLDKITDIKALIRAGESYEICLSNEFRFESRLPAL
ncbi:MAG: hypothetical protein CL521_04085, partial [Actinobacteria bacterium]|nr:hypothetical protein [Actinomycetota bacterium]